MQIKILKEQCKTKSHQVFSSTCQMEEHWHMGKEMYLLKPEMISQTSV